ncbi:MAG: aminotransferase class I/II-fold pyridoxal phosphate-dependent enzyme [Wenzhouxiangellaceae bacterium]|nr:aminotransferase class I/II-fold pyridoxal phosphate-dependent enzyme [Wenzhouxiangellaceae bacterium]
MRPGPARRLATWRREAERADGARRRRLVRRVDGRRVDCDGRRLVDFASNDYLGLADDPAVAAALAAAAGSGTGAAASALVCGHRPEHRELEARIAAFVGCEAALVTVSGYQANLAVGQALAGRGDRALADRLNHASLNDGLRLSGARISRYAHADAAAAAARCRDDTALLVTDGVFSMDGDVAPLADLAALADARDLLLWLDDAHGFGVLGDGGRGLVEAAGLAPSDIDVLVVPFGKALGTQGAAIAGDRALIETLVDRARPVIHSTAIAPPLAAATTAALERLECDHWRRERLRDHVVRFREGVRGTGIDAGNSETAIQPVIAGSNRRALALSAALEGAGFHVPAIRPPTVPEGRARLRVSLSAAHSTEDVEGLLRALVEAHDSLGEEDPAPDRARA